MKAIISADELAKDVAGAEALLERHQEHKVWTTGEYASYTYMELPDNVYKLFEGKQTFLNDWISTVLSVSILNGFT